MSAAAPQLRPAGQRQPWETHQLHSKPCSHKPSLTNAGARLHSASDDHRHLLQSVTEARGSPLCSGPEESSMTSGTELLPPVELTVTGQRDPNS